MSLTAPTAPASTPRVALPGLLAGLMIAIGVVLRFRQFLFCRSLWLDEAMLAVSIAARSPLELLQPLEYNQNAPILFLWLTKASTVVLGVNEYALRALPQSLGILALVLLTLAAKRAFGRAAMIAGASLAALSPALIRFSNEAKPYGVDAFVTAALLLAFVARNPKSRSSALGLGIIASLGVILSHPAVFTATSVWAALTWAHRKDRSGLGRVAGSGMAWILVFAISYFAVVRPASANQLVREGYSTAFLPPTTESADLLPLMVSGTFFPAFGGDGGGMPPLTPTQATLMVAGFLVVLTLIAWRHSGALALALGGPTLLSCVSAALGLYPFGVPRLMVFQYPCLLLAVAAVIGGLWPADALPRLNRLGLTLWLLVLWPSWSNALSTFSSPFVGDNFRDAYQEYAAVQLGEPVYISAKAQPAWLFYSTNWTAETRRQQELFRRRLEFYFAAGGQGAAFENRASRGGPVSPDEGRDLVFDFRGRPEILGIYTGRQWKWPSYVSEVDPGWPEHEASRVQAAAAVVRRPCEWIVFERISELSFRPLRNALRFNYNGRTERQISYPGVSIAQICH
jgi:hypothetical protein